MNTFLALCRLFYENITVVVTAILLADTFIFLVIKGGWIFAIVNGITLAVLALRLWRDYRHKSGY